MGHLRPANQLFFISKAVKISYIFLYKAGAGRSSSTVILVRRLVRRSYVGCGSGDKSYHRRTYLRVN